MIAIYGVSGETGGRVARRALREGLNVRLGARNAEKLSRLEEALRDEWGNGWESQAVDIDDSEGLKRFVAGVDVVINCAGPFQDCASPMVEAAVEGGCHYLDVSGEQSHLVWVRDHLGERAIEKELVLLPGCAFQFGLGDLAADLAVEEAAPRVVVAYAVEDFEMSEGTTRSLVRSFTRGGVGFVDGELRRRKTGSKRFDVPFPGGRKEVGIWVPGGEALTVPPRGGVSRVETCLAASDRLANWGATAMGWVPWAAEGLGTMTDKVVSWVGSKPGEESAQARFLVIAFDPRHSEALVTLRGEDIYATTAKMVVMVARQLRSSHPTKSGFLGVADLVEARRFLEALGVEILTSED